MSTSEQILQVADALEKKMYILADQLSVPVVHLMDLGISGIYTEGLIQLILLIFVTVWVGVNVYIVSQLSKNKWQEISDVQAGVLIASCVLSGFIWIMTFLIFIAGGLMKLLNPEYALLKILINMSL